jgi:uncharacterized membrane protein
MNHLVVSTSISTWGDGTVCCNAQRLFEHSTGHHRQERHMKTTLWKALAPVVVAILVALVPVPAGLVQHAWYYFAIFAGVIVALMLEPIPGAAIGLIGVTLVTLLCEWVFFSPEQLAKPGFKPGTTALAWALSGFANATVWLIFGAFMFALGYEKTGLGRRIALLLVRALGRRTLTLGYAVMAADLVLAPFTPSNTARSGGTIFPVIRNDAPRDADSGLDSSGHADGVVRADPGPDPGHHGDHYALRHRTEPRVFRQRIPAVRRLLATGGDFWGDLPRFVSADQRAVTTMNA